jgi:hypothetical protein
MTHATPSARRLALGAGLLATATLLAACSSSSNGNPTALINAGSSSSSGAAGAASSPVAAASTKAASTQAPSTKAASTKSSGGGGGSVSLGSGSFCDIARNQEAQQQKEVSAFSGSPASLKTIEEQDAKLLPEFLAIAPAAIKPDVQEIVAVDQQLLTALRKANYDVTKLAPSALSGFDTPALTKASDDITAYLSKTCGIKDPNASPSA